jgi:hypothetical protein
MTNLAPASSAGAFHVNCCLTVIDSQKFAGLYWGCERRLLQEPTLANTVH